MRGKEIFFILLDSWKTKTKTKYYFIQISVFINKVVLDHSTLIQFCYCIVSGHFGPIVAELSHCDRVLNIFTILLFYRKHKPLIYRIHFNKQCTSVKHYGYL